MMMVGFCELIDDAENIWFVLGPMLALYVYRAMHEEKFLAAAFPDQWTEFARQGSAILPAPLAEEALRDLGFKQWIKNREYQAVSAVVLGLIALQIWQY